MVVAPLQPLLLPRSLLPSVPVILIGPAAVRRLNRRPSMSSWRRFWGWSVWPVVLGVVGAHPPLNAVVGGRPVRVRALQSKELSWTASCVLVCVRMPRLCWNLCCSLRRSLSFILLICWTVTPRKSSIAIRKYFARVMPASMRLYFNARSADYVTPLVEFVFIFPAATSYFVGQPIIAREVAVEVEIVEVIYYPLELHLNPRLY